MSTAHAIARPPCPPGVHEFNTGRTYTQEGQVIRWCVQRAIPKSPPGAPPHVLPAPTTYFWDCSRGIAGTFPLEIKSNRELMDWYDGGQYGYPPCGYLELQQMLGLYTPPEHE